jgi:hypothetical protein
MFVALMLAAPAGSEAPSSPPVQAIETTGSCPSAEQVSATLAPLVAALAPSRLAAAGLRVVDLGDRYEVSADGQSSRYVDPARNCSERARVAAVFIALTLNPPVPSDAPQPPVVPPGPEAGDLSPAADVSAWSVRLGVGGRADLPPAASDRSSPVASFGGEFRASVGKGALAGSVAGGVLAPTVVTVGTVDVRQQRFPSRVTASLRHKTSGSLEIAADVGVSFVVLRLRGEGLDTFEPATRLDVGGRAGVELSLLSPASSWAPFLGLHLEYFPRPYEFEVGPLGRIGSTNSVWVGASAGISWRTEPARYSVRE